MLKYDFTERIETENHAEFFRRVRSIGCNDSALIFDFTKIHNFEPGLIKTICIAQRFAMLDNKKIIFQGIPAETRELLEKKTNVAVAF
ncbi:MAG TPA: hypothetical protein PK514_09610 [Spirochaetota bacterium]|nr:hypothetical protein [Spirochaetota bacterium]